MGIDYSFQVYVHERAAGHFLRQVAALCDHREDRSTTVVLGDGASVSLPVTCDFKAGRTLEWAELIAGRISLDLSPCFPQDDALSEYDATCNDIARSWPDGTTRFMVAYTYLMAFDGSALLPDHWLFDFTPASSGQSRLFLSSPSIRATFATLALSVESPLCLLDVEESHNIVVTAQDRQVSTRVPGPCVLWDRSAPEDLAYRELLTRLDGSSPAPPRWILGPEHVAYQAFTETLARNSQVSGAVT